VVEIEPLPRNYATETLRSSIRVQGSIVVYGFTVYSTSAAAQFVCLFDANALPADGSVPIFSWPLAAHNGVGFGWQPNGRRFDAGLVRCNSSTDASKTIGSADCLFDVQYDVLGA
jgi:hypothetical protein